MVFVNLKDTLKNETSIKMLKFKTVKIRYYKDYTPSSRVTSSRLTLPKTHNGNLVEPVPYAS